jgi:hypothetical protein
LIVSSSARASGRLVPSVSRPNAMNPPGIPRCRSAAVRTTGIQKSSEIGSGKSKRSGMTPMTVAGAPSMCTVAPTTSALLANRRSQKR